MAKKKKKSAKKRSSGGSGSFKLTINWQKWLIATIAVFVGVFILDFIIHQQLLGDLYKENYRLFTSMKVMESRMSYMIASQVLFAAFFTFLYTQGYSGKGSIAEGLRYGLYLGLLIHVPKSVGSYVWSLYPMDLLQAWAVTGVVASIILGGIVGALYNHK